MTTAASNLSLRSGTRSGSVLAAHSTVIDGPFELLDDASPDGFVWLDGDHGFVASGVAATVAPADAAAFLASIGHWSGDARLSERAGPRAVGALPFHGSDHLVVPALIVGRDADGRAWRTVIDDTDAPRLASAVPRPAPVPSEFRVSALTTRAEWCAMVDDALEHIAHGALEKVVLARAVRIDADHDFDVRAILAFLRRSQPGCIVYGDRGLVGASPELLVRKSGADVTSRPLAGTGLDRAALGSSKIEREHRLVVDAVVTALRAGCADVRADGPAPLDLADVTHLATSVTARVDPASTSIADLVAALHPTPAVAGTPRDRALETIDALESVPRGRYAGPCDWIDRNGDGEFLVALRGAEVDGSHALLHAGAGIVAGSDPEAEWLETQQKLTPMLQALVRP